MLHASLTHFQEKPWTSRLHILCQGELNIVFVTPLLSRGWFPLDFSHAPSIFVDFTLYTFSIISYSHVYSISEELTELWKVFWVLSPLRESLNLKVILGTPKTLLLQILRLLHSIQFVSTIPACWPSEPSLTLPFSSILAWCFSCGCRLSSRTWRAPLCFSTSKEQRCWALTVDRSWAILLSCCGVVFCWRSWVFSSCWRLSLKWLWWQAHQPTP